MATAEADWRNTRLTDEAIEELRAGLGKMGPLGEPSDPFTLPVIQRYCNGIGDDNPLWYDEEYAARTRWGGPIAPPTILQVESAPRPDAPQGHPSGRDRLPKPQDLPGVFAMISGGRLVFERPVRPGDTLRSQSGPHDLIVRRSSMAGRSVEQIKRTDFYNQNGELVASNYFSLFRMERGSIRDNRKYLDLEQPRYTDAEIEALYAHYERESQQRRGDRPRYWEDTRTGEDLITIAKGPFSVSNLIAYCLGWGYSGLFANKIHHLYLKNRPSERIVNTETNVEDGVVSAHWDDYFARQSGIPRAYDEGIQRIAWLGHLMTDWMGDDAFLRELKVQLRAPNLVGDISWCTGRVTGKRVENGRRLVDTEIWITNQREQKTAIGSATVELPSRE